MYKYWGFGLHILSEIEFPELLPSDFLNADVTISIGKTPDSIEGEGVLKRAFSSVTETEYLWDVKNICKYYAANGSKIVVEPLPGTDDRSVRLFLLGSVMAAILYQRGDLPFHASAIVRNGKLILFTGDSGAGKSTLLANLSEQGHEIFTDDVCVIHRQPEGTITGTASYPMIKLWDDAILRLDEERFTRDFRVRPQLPKYGHFFYDAFNQNALPVEKIFILQANGSPHNVDIVQLSSVQAFKKLEKQSYKNQLIFSRQLRAKQFSLISYISSHIPVFEVSRERNGIRVEQFVTAVNAVL